MEQAHTLGERLAQSRGEPWPPRVPAATLTERLEAQRRMHEALEAIHEQQRTSEDGSVTL